MSLCCQPSQNIWMVLMLLYIQDGFSAAQRKDTLDSIFCPSMKGVLTQHAHLSHTPALVRDDPFLHQLVVFVRSDCEPVTQLAVVERVRHFEDLSSGEREALRSFLLILEVGSDEEGVSSARG